MTPRQKYTLWRFLYNLNPKRYLLRLRMFFYQLRCRLNNHNRHKQFKH